MTPSTPLPEQGGFNERLDAILDIHDNLVLLRQAAGDDGNELRVATRQSIRTLVLEELESKAERLFEWDGGQYEPVDAVPLSVIKKLEDTNGDEELRDLLHGDIQTALGFADIREWGAEGQKDYEAMLDIVMERILADRKQHELEARIDELEHVLDGSSDTTWKREWYSVEERIAELKQELEAEL